MMLSYFIIFPSSTFRFKRHGKFDDGFFHVMSSFIFPRAKILNVCTFAYSLFWSSCRTLKYHKCILFRFRKYMLFLLLQSPTAIKAMEYCFSYTLILKMLAFFLSNAWKRQRRKVGLPKSLDLDLQNKSAVKIPSCAAEFSPLKLSWNMYSAEPKPLVPLHLYLKQKWYWKYHKSASHEAVLQMIKYCSVLEKWPIPISSRSVLAMGYQMICTISG